MIFNQIKKLAMFFVIIIISLKSIADTKKILIILGPTGSGKGTQSKILSKKLNLPHISTGDLYREEVSTSSDLSKLIKYHEKNSIHFIPEEMMIGMLLKRLVKEDCKNGFLLDGFPRSLSRAKILKEFIIKDNHDVKIFILNPKDNNILKTRISNRVICSECKKQYSLTSLSKPHCPDCKIKLESRFDDNDEKFKMKMELYKDNINKINNYLSAYQANIIEFDQSHNPEEINSKIIELL